MRLHIMPQQKVALAISFLLCGCAIYLLFRSKTLNIYHWCATLGFSSAIDTLRLWVQNWNVPDFVRFCLPDGLYCAAYILLIDAIWHKEKGIMKSGFPALGEYSARFAETGILGLVIYLLPALFLAFQLIRRIILAGEQQERERCIFFFISLSGIMASGLGDNMSITCCYWILMGLGYALILSPYKKENHEST